MPGLVGHFGRPDKKTNFQGALKILCHFPSYINQCLIEEPDVTIGAVWRKKDAYKGEHPVADDTKARVSLVFYGHAFSMQETPQRQSSATLLEKYLSDGVGFVKVLDGAFVIIILDKQKNQVIILNDRMAALPLYYSYCNGNLTIAPEAKAIMVCRALTPKFDTAGVLNFLAVGYCFGEKTLFDGIKCLTPATCLTYDCNTTSMQTRPYWKLCFRGNSVGSVSRRQLKEELHSAILNSVSMLTSDEPAGKFSLFLTGGWDSRGILGALDMLGSPPRRTLSWGLTRGYTDSDSFVAEQLSSDLGVPYEFIPMDSKGLERHMQTWCNVSELANDNYGSCAQGLDIHESIGVKNVAFLLRGDEIWCWGFSVANEIESRSMFFPPKLPELIESIILADKRCEFRGMYEESIQTISPGKETTDWTDRADLYYFYGRVAKFIMTLGHNHELGAEVRRPLLTKSVIDVVERIPKEQRYNKNLYIDMLSTYFPKVMTYGRSQTQNLPDWQYDIRKNSNIRELILDLMSSNDLNREMYDGWLDREKIQIIINDWFQEKEIVRKEDKTSVSGTLIWMKLKNAIQRNYYGQKAVAWFSRIRRKVNSTTGMGLGNISKTDLIKRLSLLNQLDRNMSEWLARGQIDERGK